METYLDSQVRVVSLNLLEATCKHISGMCHTFQVVKVSGARCYVEYSNPNEYGTPRPVQAVFPRWRCGDMDYIALDYLKIVHDDSGEGWQNFEQLRHCKLYRDKTGQWKETRSAGNTTNTLPEGQP